MSKLFPTLSEDGWVMSSRQIGDYLFAQFFASDYSQTQLYLNNVSSFAWVVKEGQGNITRTVTLLRDTLQNYFGRYFPEVTVEANEMVANPPTSNISIRLYVSYKDTDGVTWVLGRLVDVIDSKISKVVELNNGE